MRMIFAAAVAACALAGPAYAQEQGGRFTGAHLGVIVGIDHAKLSVEGETEEDEDVSLGAEGFAYGITGGFDFQAGANAVFGIEAEASDATTRLCEEEICAYARRDLYIGGRVGFVSRQAGLVYVKAGYTNARMGVDEDGIGLGSGDLDGVRVGAGVELSTGTPLNFKVEYRYSNYELGFSRHQGILGLGLRF